MASIIENCCIYMYGLYARVESVSFCGSQVRSEGSYLSQSLNVNVRERVCVCVSIGDQLDQTEKCAGTFLRTSPYTLNAWLTSDQTVYIR